MGENFDETTIYSGKKPTKRNRERSILEIVRRIHLETGQPAPLNDVFNEAERIDINRSSAEEIIEAMCTDGRLFRPLYDTLAPA